MERDTLQTLRALDARISALEEAAGKLGLALKDTVERTVIANTEIVAIAKAQSRLKSALAGAFVIVLLAAAFRVIRSS